MLKRAAGDAKEPVVVINADAQATHQSVVHMMEAARAAGLTHITFATQASPAAPREVSARRGRPAARAGMRARPTLVAHAAAAAVVAVRRAARRLRRAAYRARGLRRASALPVPVVVVGNITVGGSGKTPLVAALVEALRDARPPSRHREPRLRAAHARRARSCSATDDARDVGDEPLLLAATGVPVVRRAAIARRRRARCSRRIRRSTCIVADDGLQHYALARDVEIAVDRRNARDWATACCCRRDRCASRRRGSHRSTPSSGAAGDGGPARSVPGTHARSR